MDRKTPVARAIDVNRKTHRANFARAEMHRLCASAFSREPRRRIEAYLHVLRVALIVVDDDWNFNRVSSSQLRRQRRVGKERLERPEATRHVTDLPVARRSVRTHAPSRNRISERKTH